MGERRNWVAALTPKGFILTALEIAAEQVGRKRLAYMMQTLVLGDWPSLVGALKRVAYGAGPCEDLRDGDIDRAAVALAYCLLDDTEGGFARSLIPAVEGLACPVCCSEDADPQFPVWRVRAGASGWCRPREPDRDRQHRQGEQTRRGQERPGDQGAGQETQGRPGRQGE